MENERDCPHCKHYVRVKGKDGKYEDYYMCEKWDCEYEPEQEGDYDSAVQFGRQSAAVYIID